MQIEQQKEHKNKEQRCQLNKKQSKSLAKQEKIEPQLHQIYSKLTLQNKISQKKKAFKIVAISDTHGNSTQIQNLIQNKQSGDIFIHCGDFTRYGRQHNFQEFVTLLKSLNFRYKIVLAGNHQISLDPSMKPSRKKKYLDKYPCKYSRQQILAMLQKQCIYLEHQYLQIQGIKIFGSPYTQKHGSSAFQYSKADDQKVWSNLPQIDILITHSPPYGILDQINQGKSAGSHSLRSQVFRIKPKIHLFGHIHEGRGQTKKQGIHFMNVAKQAVKVKLCF